MKTTTLLIEFLIIGFLSSIIIFLCYALLYPVNFDTLWIILNENKGYGAIVITIVFYALGAIIHRVIENFLKWVIKLIDKIKKIEKVNENENEKAKMLNALQNGSDSLNNRLIYELSLMRMFGSFSILLPVIGVMYFVLDSKTDYINSGTFVLILSLIITGASILCYVAQKRSVKLFTDVFENMKGNK